MLKPSRKILRKEIKKDPLLEGFEKIERGFEKNRKILFNTLIILTALTFGVMIFINNQNKIEMESSSAFGTALVAYSNLDYDNAKFQFESISSSYEGTESEIFSDYYMGKISYELGDYDEAKLFLNDFLENTKDAILVCGAIKLLIDISFQENNFLKSFEILAKGKKFDINNISKLELKLLEINTYIKINDLENARIEIGKILNNSDLPLYVRQKVDELQGML